MINSCVLLISEFRYVCICLCLYVCLCAHVYTHPFHFMWVYMCFPHTCTCRMPYCVRPLYSPGPSCWVRGIEEGSHLTERDKFHKMHEVLTCTHYHSVAESVFLVLQVSNTCVVCCSCVCVLCTTQSHSAATQPHTLIPLGCMHECPIECACTCSCVHTCAALHAIHPNFLLLVFTLQLI